MNGSEFYIDLPVLRKESGGFYDLEKNMKEYRTALQNSEKYLRYNLSGGPEICEKLQQIQADMEEYRADLFKMGQTLAVICEQYRACEETIAETHIEFITSEGISWDKTKDSELAGAAAVIAGAGAVASSEVGGIAAGGMMLSKELISAIGKVAAKAAEDAIKGGSKCDYVKYNWTKEGLPSSEFVTPEFLEKVVEIADKLEISPDDLMAVMAFESGFNPAVKNPGSSATGLIQFMKKTAESLGTSVDDLSKMSGVQQLEYVYEYYKPFTGKMEDLSDVYMVTLRQIAVGEPNDYPLFKKGDGRYEVNNGLDYNGDGIVTKEEATRKVIEKRNSYE